MFYDYYMLTLLYRGVLYGMYHFLYEVHLFVMQNLYLCYEWHLCYIIFLNIV